MQPALAVSLGVHDLARQVRGTMPIDDGDLMMKIGQLLEGTRTLGRDIQDIKAQQIANAARADRDRSELHNEVSKVSDRVGAVEDGQADLQRKVTSILVSQDKMQKVADTVTRLQYTAGGAIGVTGIAFTALGWLLAHYWDRIFP
jgi:hypothetical protein